MFEGSSLSIAMVYVTTSNKKEEFASEDERFFLGNNSIKEVLGGSL